ncbi:hypothetical protein QTN47_15985 [Danxiaibacter flavus]|uniref:PH domain-containing protein n=1 Tax=Danxiaibacter flavus TaxID=3049108 RepID=A0ABV3ZGR7_9BACT|nr:hypothetical protein QNM32_15995 [Chitinophagaceae bacterium DXS]
MKWQNPISMATHNEVLFSERQKFKQWWLFLGLFAVNGLFLFGVYKQVFKGQQFGDKPMSDSGLLIGTGLTMLMTLLFLNFRLDTVIKTDGIYVRFFPFHIKYRQYSWSNLKKVYIRKYSALKEYGGWGLRFGRNGKAFNVSGNEGLQLEFNNGKRLLVGTNKAEELKSILDKIGRMKE